MQSEVDLSYALTGFSLDDVVVFDTETTGLDPYGGDEIVSIGICDGHGNKLFYSLVKPTRKRSWKEAEAIHGISPQDVKDAPKIKQIADEIRSHILGDKLVVGYNVEYDLMMLDAAGVIDGMPPNRFDVMRQYATVHGTKPAKYGREGYQWSKLGVCAVHYGYWFNAHNSLEDALAAAYCYRSMLSDSVWAKRHLVDISGKLKHVSLSQNKDSSENVKALVSSGTTTSMPAELRLGVVTQGANKGKPRYECFIDDLCVGVQRHGDLDGIRRLFMASDQGQLPDVIKCRATMTADNDKAKCVATISEGGTILEAVKAAEAEREAARPGKGSPNSPVEPIAKENRIKHAAFSWVKALMFGIPTVLAIMVAFAGLMDFEASLPWMMSEAFCAAIAAFFIKKMFDAFS